jgi:hypothetical protein
MLIPQARNILEGIIWPIKVRDLKTVLISKGLCSSHDVADRIVNKWLYDGTLLNLEPWRIRDPYVRWVERPDPTKGAILFGQSKFVPDRRYGD